MTFDAKWLARDLWTLLEAAQICAGIEPFAGGPATDNPHTVLGQISDDNVRNSVNEFYARSKDAIDVGRLKHSGTRTGSYGNYRVRPLAYFQWAVNSGLPTSPDVLLPLQRHSTLEDASPSTQPRDAITAIKSRGGRPPTRDKKAKVLRQILEAFESVSKHRFTPNSLPGSAANLLDACQRLERSKTDKALVFGTASEDTLKEWVKSAGYGWPSGRTPKAEQAFWTLLVPKTTGKINADIFTEVYGSDDP